MNAESGVFCALGLGTHFYKSIQTNLVVNTLFLARFGTVFDENIKIAISQDITLSSSLPE